jgi:monoterpene epsilon-lactone hydrolase
MNRDGVLSDLSSGWAGPTGAPSTANVALAVFARATLRPLGSCLAADATGAKRLDRLLRGILALTSTPRPGVAVAAVDTTHAGARVRGEWVTAAGVGRDGPPILYVHGGAFVACSPRTHRGLVAELSATARRAVFVVAYRLVPQHPFPAAADDVLAAYRWLCDSDGAGIAGPVALAGDSAGGQLAVATTLAAKAHQLPGPDAVLLMSPVLDLTGELALARDRRHPDPFAAARAAARMLALYTAGVDNVDPRLSVLGADLHGFPPTLIQVGDREMLLDDARRLAQRLQESGAAVALQVWPGQLHVFPAMFRLLPEARHALARSGEILRRDLSTPTACPAVFPHAAGA